MDRDPPALVRVSAVQRIVRAEVCRADNAGFRSIASTELRFKCLKVYPERLPTQHEHAREIRQRLGYRDFGVEEFGHEQQGETQPRWPPFAGQQLHITSQQRPVLDQLVLVHLAGHRRTLPSTPPPAARPPTATTRQRLCQLMHFLPRSLTTPRQEQQGGLDPVINAWVANQTQLGEDRVDVLFDRPREEHQLDGRGTVAATRGDLAQNLQLPRGQPAQGAWSGVSPRSSARRGCFQLKVKFGGVSWR
jgi:hypothetical protein